MIEILIVVQEISGPCIILFATGPKLATLILEHAKIVKVKKLFLVY